MAIVACAFACSDEPDRPGTTSGTPVIASALEVPTDGARVALASGLEIEELAVGDGKVAMPGSRVTAHVLGTFPDGRKFWSSRDQERTARGFTARLQSGPGGVIEGWVQGVPGMREDGKRRLYVPWSLAYGEQGTDIIPPRSDLVFEIELIEVE